MPGIVYILTNAAMPGLVKIRITESNVEDRIKGLDNTSVPIPFECFYAAQVTDVAKVERAIHEAFGDNRRVMGLPGKPDGIRGEEVDRYYREGRIR
jgi:T5orf172 domain